jgi:hypothetical protein
MLGHTSWRMRHLFCLLDAALAKQFQRFLSSEEQILLIGLAWTRHDIQPDSFRLPINWHKLDIVDGERVCAVGHCKLLVCYPINVKTCVAFRSDAKTAKER